MRMLRRHGLDIALCALAAAVLATSLGDRVANARYGAALMAVALLVLLGRGRRPPLASVIGFAIIAAGGRIMPQITSVMFLAILASFAVAGIAVRRAAAVAGWVAGCVALLIAMVGNPYVEGAGDVILTLTFCTVIWAASMAAAEWGRQAGRAHARAEGIAATRDRDVAAATIHERARIAGELHDVVSHGLSIVILQTVAARMSLRDDGDPVPETDRRLSIVENSARDALDDMRRLLDLLRATDLSAAGGELTPSVGLDQVPALVEQGRLAGVRLDATIDRSGPPLSPGLDAAAYRIVQEAITNVIKHAPDAATSLLVRSDTALLEVAVESVGAAPAHPATQPDGGYGLIGMRQRAELYGGRLDAGPCSGGFTVRARFPLGRAQ